MNLFSFPADEVLTAYDFAGQPENGGRVQKVARGDDQPGGPRLAADRGTRIDLADQFLVFQLNGQLEGPAILESTAVEPKIEGGPDQPDVLVALEMLSFQFAHSEGIDKDAKATLRLNLGKDESSTDRRFDAVFWSIAAGLSLYDEARQGRADGKDLKADFHKAFGNRPVEIPGGLGRLWFTVVRHKEATWWQRTFRFLQSDTGKKLVSVLGFPAVTQQAIGLLDQLLEKLEGADPKPLFKSLPMRLALSKYARTEFVGGSQRIRMGCLTSGFAILARGRDFATLNKSNVVYNPTYGKLVPADVSEQMLLEGDYDDPLKDVTYVVMRVGMKGTKLDPTFNYSS
jgi:hypothetical protein